MGAGSQAIVCGSRNFVRLQRGADPYSSNNPCEKQRTQPAVPPTGGGLDFLWNKTNSYLPFVLLCDHLRIHITDTNAYTDLIVIIMCVVILWIKTPPSCLQPQRVKPVGLPCERDFLIESGWSICYVRTASQICWGRILFPR